MYNDTKCLIILFISRTFLGFA